MLGTIFDIQRFSIHDGPGIRTTVFLKGCPLHCLWCHNPESQAKQVEIFFSPEKCIGCQFCLQACPHGNHLFQDGVHLYQRDQCEACGKCTAECYPGALELVGKPMHVEQVLKEVMKDLVFYRNSGGGMTLSGGEPMMQFEFTRGLLQAARQNGLHTCIETSGCAPLTQYREILPWVDLFLFDVKETDPDRHRQYTGVSNKILYETLAVLDHEGARIILRCPIIPGLNDRPDHFKGIAALAESLTNVQEIHVLPYHALGESKNRRLGKEPPLAGIAMPESSQTQTWVEQIQKHSRIQTRIV